jgi:HD-GYP domain-containing protein (c-di-GMP phosphodiesterase class II)
MRKKCWTAKTLKALYPKGDDGNVARQASQGSGTFENVSRLCQNIGKALNLSESEISRVKDVRFLHDIGIIAIEAEVIDKTMPLTD